MTALPSGADFPGRHLPDGPRYSIIIPVFNRVTKIGRAIESCRKAARFSPDCIEVIVVDDASSDGSGEAARAAKADRVITLTANLGVTGARNRGIEAATGQFLVFLDSDDELTEEALLESDAHFAASSQTDVLFGSCVDRDGARMHRRDAKMGKVDYVAMLTAPAPGEFMPVVRRAGCPHFQFEERLRGFEGITWLKAARSGKAIFYTRKVLRRYDKGGQDRLCRRENIIRDAKRLATGWEEFLREFGDDLLRLRPRVYGAVVLRMVVYRKLAGVAGGGTGAKALGGGPFGRAYAFGLELVAACVPRSLVRRGFTWR